MPAFRFHFHERRRGDGLDLRHHQVGFLGFDDATEFVTVEHVDHVAAVGDLHPRGVGVAIHGDHFDAEALQFDDDFLAEFAGAEGHHPGGARRQRRTDPSHGASCLALA